MSHPLNNFFVTSTKTENLIWAYNYEDCAENFGYADAHLAAYYFFLVSKA